MPTVIGAGLMDPLRGSAKLQSGWYRGKLKNLVPEQVKFAQGLLFLSKNQTFNGKGEKSCQK
jgi:hypothetical protein